MTQQISMFDAPADETLDVWQIMAQEKAQLQSRGMLAAWIQKTVDVNAEGAQFLKNGGSSYKSSCPCYSGFWLNGGIGSVQCSSCSSLLPGIAWYLICSRQSEKCSLRQHEPSKAGG